MVSKQTGKQHRRHRSRAEADRLAAEYEASGLSQADFCTQEDVPLKTLGRYLTRYRKQRAVVSQPQRWVAVEVSGHSGCGLAVLLSTGHRIEVKRGFDPGTLRQLVAVLEQA
ncbi:MAG: hypothetical protein QOH67_4598 [Hyphomicrobiales bacterium]|nr:hypothetical protein [Hyphomicrobiales bacterium]